MPERQEIQLRITLISPPGGVWYCLQDKKNALSGRQVSTGADLVFQLPAEADATGRLFGPMVMGPPDVRFVYLCIGTSAGQLNSPWTRRAKIPLRNVPFPLPAGKAAAVRVQGTAKDGSPACATLPLLDGGWKIEPA